MSSAHKKSQSKRNIAKELKHVKKQLWNQKHSNQTHTDDSSVSTTESTAVAEEISAGVRSASPLGVSEINDRRLLEIKQQFRDYRRHTERALAKKVEENKSLQKELVETRQQLIAAVQFAAAADGTSSPTATTGAAGAAASPGGGMSPLKAAAAAGVLSGTGPTLFSPEQQLEMASENVDLQDNLKRATVELEVLKRRFKSATERHTQELQMAIQAAEQATPKDGIGGSGGTSDSSLLLQLQLRATVELLSAKLQSVRQINQQLRQQTTHPQQTAGGKLPVMAAATETASSAAVRMRHSRCSVTMFPPAPSLLAQQLWANCDLLNRKLRQVAMVSCMDVERVAQRQQKEMEQTDKRVPLGVEQLQQTQQEVAELKTIVTSSEQRQVQQQQVPESCVDIETESKRENDGGDGAIVYGVRSSGSSELLVQQLGAVVALLSAKLATVRNELAVYRSKAQREMASALLVQQLQTMNEGLSAKLREVTAAHRLVKSELLQYNIGALTMQSPDAAAHLESAPPQMTLPSMVDGSGGAQKIKARSGSRCYHDDEERGSDSSGDSEEDGYGLKRSRPASRGAVGAGSTSPVTTVTGKRNSSVHGSPPVLGKALAGTSVSASSSVKNSPNAKTAGLQNPANDTENPSGSARPPRPIPARRNTADRRAMKAAAAAARTTGHMSQKRGGPSLSRDSADEDDVSGDNDDANRLMLTESVDGEYFTGGSIIDSCSAEGPVEEIELEFGSLYQLPADDVAASTTRVASTASLPVDSSTSAAVSRRILADWSGALERMRESLREQYELSQEAARLAYMASVDTALQRSLNMLVVSGGDDDGDDDNHDDNANTEAGSVNHRRQARDQEHALVESLQQRIQELREDVILVRKELVRLVNKVESIQQGDEEKSQKVAYLGEPAESDKTAVLVEKLRTEIALLEQRIGRSEAASTLTLRDELLVIGNGSASVNDSGCGSGGAATAGASPLLVQQLQATNVLLNAKLQTLRREMETQADRLRQEQEQRQPSAAEPVVRSRAASIAASVSGSPFNAVPFSLADYCDADEAIAALQAQHEAELQHVHISHLHEMEQLSDKYNIAAGKDKKEALEEQYQQLTEVHLEHMDALQTQWDAKLQEAVATARQFVKDEMTETLKVSVQVERDLSAALKSAEQSLSDTELKLELANEQIAELDTEIRELKDSYAEAGGRHDAALESITEKLQQAHSEKLEAAVAEATANARSGLNEEVERQLAEQREQWAAMYEDREAALLNEHESALDHALSTLDAAKDQEAKDRIQQALDEQWNELEEEKNAALDDQWNECEKNRVAALEILEQQHEAALQQAVEEKQKELNRVHEAALGKQKEELEKEFRKVEKVKINEIVTACRKVEAQSKLLIEGLESEVAGLQAQVAEKEERFAEEKGDALRALSAERDAQQQLALNELSAHHAQELREVMDQREEALSQYSSERAERRRLHNKLQDVLGTIRVVCRVRPVTFLENSQRTGTGQPVVEFPPKADNALLLMRDPRFPQARTRYEYDRVYGPNSTQLEVFEYVRPLCVSVLDGYNVCLFAYGQTGSGKTYTMEGFESPVKYVPPAAATIANASESGAAAPVNTQDDSYMTDADKEAAAAVGPGDGVAPRAISELLTQVRSRGSAWQYEISMSMLQIYNESIQDLLVTEPNNSAYSASTGGGVTAGSSSAASANREKLDVRKAPDGSQYIPGLSSYQISSMAQVRGLMRTGYANRAAGAHGLNDKSSRSHLLTTVVAKGTNIYDGATTYGKMHLIDLAGSERLGKTDATGERLREAQNINKSLSALGDVVDALAVSGRRRAAGGGLSTAAGDHVPYRNSKLTFLLADSLGGTSKVLTFVTVSPSEYNLSETVCSLNFATRCRGTDLGQAKRQSTAGSIPAASSSSSSGIGAGSENMAPAKRAASPSSRRSISPAAGEAKSRRNSGAGMHTATGTPKGKWQ